MANIICVIIDIDFKSMVYLLARAAEICRPHLLYFIIILFPHSASKSLSKFSMSSPSFLQEEKEKEKNLNSGPPSWINHHRGRCYTIVVVVAVVVFIVVVVVVAAVIVILLSSSLLPFLLSLPTSSLLPSLLSLPTSSSLLLLPSWRKNPKLTPTAAVENFGEEYQNFGHIQGVKIRKNDYLFIR